MPENQDAKIQHVTAEFIYHGWIGQEELCTRLGIGPDLLEICMQWEIVHPAETSPGGAFHFPTEALDRLYRGLRLHRDLGINWPGVSVALDLLERIEELERRLEEPSKLESMPASF